MINYNFSFVLLHISTISVLLMFIFIFRMKNKKQIHYAFICNIGLMLIWSLGYLLEAYARYIYGYTIMLFVYFWNIGLCMIPVSILFTALIFAKTRIKFSYKHYLILVPPIISYLILITNKYHNLFFVTFSTSNQEIIYGKYFIFHSLYSYTCIILSFYYFVYFSIKNSGFFSKQSILILVGCVIPFIVNLSFTVKIVSLPAYSTAIAFTFAVICYMFAILKFNFLNIAPIALQTIVDRISDSFVVINEEYNIVDFNKTFIDNFGCVGSIKRNDNFISLLKSKQDVNIDADQLFEYFNRARDGKKTISFESHIQFDNFDRFFAVEITPIISNDKFLGTLVLLKDITQSKRDLETIKHNQAILMEQERLASLGQLIGGIAHNLKTPIMSLAGGIEALKDLVVEYDESIDDNSVTREDHHEIAGEMLEWLNKMKPYCSYMSDIISAVKGQAVQLNDSSTSKFTIDELVKRIDVLMKHELKRYHCILNTDFQVDMNTEIKGEVNNLVQIFDNIIINAVHSYEGKSGKIDFKIDQKNDIIEFTVKDYGKGIPSEIKDRLFKEMITTKGKNGTGLGLYMSYSTIKGRFGGNMRFTSQEGEGTTFYISIPCLSYRSSREVV